MGICTADWMSFTGTHLGEQSGHWLINNTIVFHCKYHSLLLQHFGFLYSFFICHSTVCFARRLTSMVCCYWCCSVAQSCPTLCDPMDCSMPGSPALHYLLAFVQIHYHWVGDAQWPASLCKRAGSLSSLSSLLFLQLILAIWGVRTS